MHGASLTPQATAGRELRRIIIFADALLLSETEVDEFPCVLPKFPEKKSWRASRKSIAQITTRKVEDTLKAGGKFCTRCAGNH